MRPEYFGRDLLASAVIVAIIAAIVGIVKLVAYLKGIM